MANLAWGSNFPWGEYVVASLLFGGLLGYDLLMHCIFGITNRCLCQQIRWVTLLAASRRKSKTNECDHSCNCNREKTIVAAWKILWNSIKYPQLFKADFKSFTLPCAVKKTDAKITGVKNRMWYKMSYDANKHHAKKMSQLIRTSRLFKTRGQPAGTKPRGSGANPPRGGSRGIWKKDRKGPKKDFKNFTAFGSGRNPQGGGGGRRPWKRSLTRTQTK